MLTENEKDKIRLEEHFRIQVRNQIESKNKTKKNGKVIEFLNTSLGLFILSTVFVSAFSWTYSVLKSNYIEKKEARKKNERMFIEVNNRLKYVKKIAHIYPGEERVAIRTAIFGLNNSNFESSDPHPAYSPIYEEYRNNSLIGLITELKFEKNISSKKTDSVSAFLDMLPDYYWKSISIDDKYWKLPDSLEGSFIKDYNRFALNFTSIYNPQ